MAPDSLIHPAAIAEMCELVRNGPPGCVVELGVYKGGSAFHLAAVAREQGRAVYLFDTFSGIPFKAAIDVHHAGDFGDTSIEAVRAAIPDAFFCPGVFPDSMVPMPPIAFVHVDADQYQSLKDAIAHFTPLMVPGASIVFDDVGCMPGADLAAKEWEDELGYPLGRTAHNKAIWTKP